MLVHEEVRAALDEGPPVVALESTLIAHGLPRPDNLRVAREIEAGCASGACRRRSRSSPARSGRARRRPARALAASDDVAKCGVRDLAPVLARGEDGATTVAATSHLAGAPASASSPPAGSAACNRGAPTPSTSPRTSARWRASGSASSARG